MPVITLADPDTFWIYCGSYIDKHPGVCGGAARIRKTRHTVAGLVEWRQLGLPDERILEHHPDLAPDDLLAAWQYYAAHRDEIEQEIKENQDE